MYRAWHRVQCTGCGGPTLGGQSQLVPFQVPCRRCLASDRGGGPFGVCYCEVLELVAPLGNSCACSLQRRRHCSRQHTQTGSTLSAATCERRACGTSATAAAFGPCSYTNTRHAAVTDPGQSVTSHWLRPMLLLCAAVEGPCLGAMLSAGSEGLPLSPCVPFLPLFSSFLMRLCWRQASQAPCIVHGDLSTWVCCGWIVRRKVTCLSRAAELATCACCAQVQVRCLLDAAVVGMEVSLVARTLLSESRVMVVGVATIFGPVQPQQRVASALACQMTVHQQEFLLFLKFLLVALCWQVCNWSLPCRMACVMLVLAHRRMHLDCELGMEGARQGHPALVVVVMLWLCCCLWCLPVSAS